MFAKKVPIEAKKIVFVFPAALNTRVILRMLSISTIVYMMKTIILKLYVAYFSEYKNLNSSGATQMAPLANIVVEI